MRWESRILYIKFKVLKQYMMRKIIWAVILLGMTTLQVSAQEFKLYFANNVTDVVDFNNIEAAASGLQWREVKNKELAGNVVEVDSVKQMFASPEVKYRAQQRQFWRMRDHCLLCFRIDDNTAGANSYQVEVEDTIGRSKAITVNRFFFLNVMRQENPISVKVWNTANPDDAITFKYYVADWDDNNLYTFQLDSKRRLDNEVYKLEYRYSYADAEGTYQVESRQLSLRDSAFQSFYIADNQNLIDVFLMSNDHKLRLNKKRLHTGVTLDPDFERTVLSSRFTLDKHENRELVNFNWIGSGLYEQYDTLYLSVINEAGGNITRATVHVDPVDENGVSTGVQDVKYLGYNRQKKAHLILTHGNPAYIEILANGYCPTVYRYDGAADKEGIVDLERCSDNVVLFENPTDDNTIAISSQHLYALNDTHTVEERGGKDYSICSIADYDLSTVVMSDTITYMEDAGNDWPKTLNGNVVQRLAQLELVYSSEGSQDITGTRLIATNDDTGEEYVSRWPDVTTVYAKNHPGFTRDYYFSTFNLVGTIPQNTMCSLHLEASGKHYDRFPYLRNLHIERENVKKAAEDYTTNTVMNQGDDDKPANAFAEQGCSFNFPFDFKMNLGPLFTIRNTLNYDMKKQKLTNTTRLIYKRKDGKDEDEGIKEMRKEAREFLQGSESGNTWYDDGDGDTKYNNVGDTRKFDDWFTSEMDDICSVDFNKIGTGFFGSGKVKVGFNLGTLMKTGNIGESLTLEEASGQIGYGMCLASPSLLDKYCSEGAVANLLKKIPFFGIGGVFEASVQGDFGVKMLNAKFPMSWDNFGFFFTLSAKIRAGLWAEFCVPSNPIFAANLGLRGGGKIGIMGGFATPFQAHRFNLGMYGMSGMGIEAYANIRTFGFQWSGRAGVYLASHFYYPDNGHNPLHPDYPYWLTDKNAKTVGESYRRVPWLAPDYFGETIVTDIASDANPHFVDEKHIVYNDLGTPDDYNDDGVKLLDTEAGTTVKLSSDERSAIHHMRSKRGDNEVVVYEQMTRHIDANEMNADHAISKSNELAACAQIMASVKLSGKNTWQQYTLSKNDGMVDTHPVVTMQDDGKAACIWQHGTIQTLDESLPEDSIYNNALTGQLVLSIFDGQEWSEPITLHNLDADLTAQEYDLIMRNDTVLVGTNLESYPLDSVRHSRRFVYSSVDVATKKVFQKAETLKPSHFFMNRVGQYSVIAMLYEKTDSLRDVYVKTLSMNGYADGVMGSDIGANYCTPNRVKIITDRAAVNCNDFAILWTEMSNNAHYEDGQEGYTETPRNMLNASRIALQPSPFVTVPLTLGTERDGLSIMDFDGILDDSRIKVVYSLADIETGGAVLMTNEKYFTNSFDYDIGYASLSLLGCNSLPVAVTVSNTGTSSIRNVTATINGEDFPIENSFVAPMQKRTFVVEYPLHAGFDGYLTNAVTVEYNNVFKTQNHPRRRNISLRRQTKTNETPHHVDLEDIELRLVRHSVEADTNIYVVELIDHTLYGLKDRNAIKVGLYPHPSIVVPVSDEAETIVTSADFEDYGGQRKAYATVKISGVMDQAHAYLTTHLFDQYVNSDISVTHVKNYSGSDNAHYVSLLPHQDPTVIRQLQREGKQAKIQLTKTDGGINVRGLNENAHLRVFTSGGMLVFSKKATGTHLFVPLKHQDTYLISTGNEVLKFAY